MSGDDAWRGLREEFGAELLRRLDDLRRSVDRGEVERAVRLAHTLKGSALALGLEGVADGVADVHEALVRAEPSLEDAGGAVARARAAANEELAATLEAWGAERLAALGHDLRTPLGAVAGFAQLLRESELTVEQRRHVEGIVDATGQLATLLDAAIGASGAPAGPRRTPGPGEAAAGPAVEPGDGEPTDRLTVVYVEDDPASVAVLEGLFRFRPQVRLVVALTGAEGLALAAAMRPGLVLLDLGLPDLDGTEVFRRLREFSPPPAVAVVSGDARPERIAELREAGVDEYFEKPVDTGRLLGLVDALARA